MAFVADEFEYVATDAELALLRLSGRWTGEAPAGCLLVVATGAGEQRFAPLPQAADADPWRAAYTVPAAIVDDAEARHWLAPPEGGRLELPAPIEHGTSARVIAELRARVTELEELVARVRLRIEVGDDRLAEIERRAEELRSAIGTTDVAPA